MTQISNLHDIYGRMTALEIISLALVCAVFGFVAIISRQVKWFQRRAQTAEEALRQARAERNLALTGSAHERLALLTRLREEGEI